MPIYFNNQIINDPRTAFMRALSGAGWTKRVVYTGDGPPYTRFNSPLNNRFNDEIPIADSLYAQRDEVMKVAKRWINQKLIDPLKWVFKPHKPFAMNHRYPKDECLALALLGTVEYQESKRREQALANKVYKARGRSNRLNTILRMVRTKYQEVKGNDMYDDISKDHVGKYILYWGGVGQSFRRTFKFPQRRSVGAKIGVLHDLCDYYYASAHRGLKALVTVPGAKSKSSYIHDLDPQRRGRTRPRVHMMRVRTEDMKHAERSRQNAGYRRSRGRGWRYPDGTLNEINRSIITVRYLKRYIVWGPSFTTARMMRVASSAEVADGSKEMEALTWAIFAFWQTKYRRSVTGIHTYHNVRDMGRNFGVAFNPVAEIPSESPTF